MLFFCISYKFKLVKLSTQTNLIVIPIFVPFLWRYIYLCTLCTNYLLLGRRRSFNEQISHSTWSIYLSPLRSKVSCNLEGKWRQRQWKRKKKEVRLLDMYSSASFSSISLTVSHHLSWSVSALAIARLDFVDSCRIRNSWFYRAHYNPSANAFYWHESPMSRSGYEQNRFQDIFSTLRNIDFKAKRWMHRNSILNAILAKICYFIDVSPPSEDVVKIQ